MTGVPTVHVLLDDGSGTFPTDITTHTSLRQGLTRTMGRSDQLDTISPGTLTLTLDNGDNTFYGSGSTVTLSLDQMIRVTVNGVNRFTGYIQSLPVAWPSGGDEFSTVTITATDAMARFARMTLGTPADEEILVDSPVAYYRMSSPQGATREYDASGFGTGPLRIVNNGGTVPDWGADYGSPEGTTGVKFAKPFQTPLARVASNLESFTATNIWTSTTLHLECVFTIDPVASTFVSLLTMGNFANPPTPFSVQVFTSSASLLVSATAVPLAAPLADGLPHVISVEATITGGGSGTMDVWVDGSKVASAVAFSTSLSSFVNGYFTVGDDASSAFGADLTYTIANVNYGPRLSDARVAVHHAALLADYSGETPDERYTRLAAYTGVTTGTLDTAGDTINGPVAQNGKSLADVLDDTSSAALGIAYVDEDGTLSSLNGTTISSQSTPVLSADANWTSEDTVVQNDLTNLTNDVTGKATASENTITARNNASIATHGTYSASFEWNVSTDDQAEDLTWWQANNFGTARPRVPQLTFDLMTMTSVTAALNVTLGSYVQVTGFPEQSPLGTTLNLIVEGLTETISDSEWSLTVNTVQRDAVGGWILGNSTFGVLGTTTKLFV